MGTTQKRLSSPVSASLTREGPILIGLSRARSRALVSHTLAGLDREVVAVTDGYHLTQRLADVILGDDSRRPSLIVANPILLGCTGISLLSGLRDLGWATPVIFLVEARANLGHAGAWSEQATAVFIEPIDLGELRRVVRLALEPAFDLARLAEGTDPGNG